MGVYLIVQPESVGGGAGRRSAGWSEGLLLRISVFVYSPGIALLGMVPVQTKQCYPNPMTLDSS